MDSDGGETISNPKEGRSNPKGPDSDSKAMLVSAFGEEREDESS